MDRACDATDCGEEAVKIMVKHDTCKTKGTYVKTFKKGIVNRDVKNVHIERNCPNLSLPPPPPSKIGNKIERNCLGL